MTGSAPAAPSAADRGPRPYETDSGPLPPDPRRSRRPGAHPPRRFGVHVKDTVAVTGTGTAGAVADGGPRARITVD